MATFAPLDYPSRRQRIIPHLDTSRQDALAITNIKNIHYLSGFSGSEGAILASAEGLLLLVDGRYINQVRRDFPEIEVAEYRDRAVGLAEAIKAKRYQTVGFEAEHLSFDLFQKLEQRLGDGAKLSPLWGLDAIRAVKDEGEVARIKAAASIVAQTIMPLVHALPRGITERDLANEIDYQVKRGGAAAMAFATIVASGANSALPHASPSPRKLAPGDVLLIDCGAVVDGYAADETMVFFVEKANENQLLVHRAVKAAHDEAIGAIRAGVKAEDIDAVARRVLASYDLERFFSHSTGHGVGLAIHEAPRLAPGVTTVLEAGMVVTVEPGVYLPHEFGVRLEDTVLVTENGCEILTNIPKAPAVINLGV